VLLEYPFGVRATHTLDEGNNDNLLPPLPCSIFMVAFQLVGQELAVEITFDMQCEDISVGIINTFGFFCGIIITLGIKKLQELFSILYGNLCFSLLITVGTIFMSIISSLELKRQEVVDFIDSATGIELEKRTPRLSRLSSVMET
jgi:hypothetical protein